MQASFLSDCPRVRKAALASVLFVVFAMMYFFRVKIPFIMVFPLTTLFLFGIGLLPWQMCLAALFSAFGDAMGVMDRLIPQIGFFMLAHFSMISFFVPRIKKLSVARKDGLLGHCVPAVLAATILVLSIVAFAFLFVISKIDGPVVLVGASLYCVVIAVMFWCSMMQADSRCCFCWMIPVGAFLFLGSDMVIAWNSFVQSIEGERYFIMVPYYLAQLLIFWGTVLTTESPR